MLILVSWFNKYKLLLEKELVCTEGQKLLGNVLVTLIKFECSSLEVWAS